jgi:hypothetical protein
MICSRSSDSVIPAFGGMTVESGLITLQLPSAGFGQAAQKFLGG